MSPGIVPPNKVAGKIDLITGDEGFGEEEVMEKIDKIQTKLKFTAFGKTKPQSNKAKKEGSCKRRNKNGTRQGSLKQTVKKTRI